MEIIFIKIPVRTISGIRKYPDPNTTALGGVATGNIKAQLAATVADTISIKGCTLIVSAMGARIGSNMAVVARFEVISVKKLTAAINMNTSKNIDSPCREVICPPIQLASPVAENPSANAIPPPKSKMIPQGIRTASSQLINFSFFPFAGRINNMMLAVMAMMVSSRAGIHF